MGEGDSPMNTWLYNDKPIELENIENYIGFVYLITNTLNDKKYIGKKLLKFKKTKTLKGKKKKILVESDWQIYYGSNDVLKKEVQEHGAENFKREIIRFCKNKSELTYFELKEQIIRGALESDKYYNSWIYVRVRKEHLKSIDFSTHI